VTLCSAVSSRRAIGAPMIPAPIHAICIVENLRRQFRTSKLSANHWLCRCERKLRAFVHQSCDD
jgi:hypothetical protein